MPDTTLDPAAILAALGVTGARAITPIAGGWDTSIWRVEHGGARYALRVFRAEQAETCRREVAAMRAAAIAGLPLPAVHAEGAWQDRPALLLSWCPGRPLVAEVSAHPWRLWKLGTAVGRMQARIHAVPAPPALAGEPPAWIGWAGPAVEARLRALHPRTDALLHLDYHPLNVMASGGRITAVLDWANAHAGDPRADLARTVCLLRLAPAPPGTPRILDTAGRRLLELAWRRGYARLIGPIPDLATFLAWAGAWMIEDMTPQLGRPGIWLAPQHLASMRRAVAGWKRRAGIAAPETRHGSRGRRQNGDRP